MPFSDRVYQFRSRLKTLPALRGVYQFLGKLSWRTWTPLRRACSSVLLAVRLIGIACRHRKAPTVICRLGAMGDVICSLPTARNFIVAHPEQHVVFVTRRPFG